MLQKTRQIAGLQPLANATRTRSKSATFTISNVRGHPSSSGGGPQPLYAYNCCHPYLAAFICPEPISSFVHPQPQALKNLIVNSCGILDEGSHIYSIHPLPPLSSLFQASRTGERPKLGSQAAVINQYVLYFVFFNPFLKFILSPLNM